MTVEEFDDLYPRPHECSCRHLLEHHQPDIDGGSVCRFCDCQGYWERKAVAR